MTSVWVGWVLLLNHAVVGIGCFMWGFLYKRREYRKELRLVRDGLNDILVGRSGPDEIRALRDCLTVIEVYHR